MVRFILGLLLALLCVACGNSPTAPTKNDIPCALGYHRVDTSTTSNCQPN